MQVFKFILQITNVFDIMFLNKHSLEYKEQTRIRLR